LQRAADVHPSLLEQAAPADLMSEGHFDRHLRRMRAAYRERLEALTDAADRWCRGALAVRPVHTGLHAVADLIDAERVSHHAALRSVEVTPLSHCFLGRPRSMMASVRSTNAIVLGFASVRPDAIRRGMEHLAAAIEDAERPEGSRVRVRHSAGGRR
jgi:GntR family transcriptional regulator / MocR family aminotransferase